VGFTFKQRREEFLAEVERCLRGSVKRERLLTFSSELKRQLESSLLDNPQNMLPSYNHQLPTGDECGTYLALDVGGSTFRVALIELSGRKSEAQESKILKTRSVKIDQSIRQLKGLAFFDWIAQRVEETLSGQSEGHDMSGAPLSMGMAWSFPIEYDSLVVAYSSKSADPTQANFFEERPPPRNGQRLPSSPRTPGSGSWRSHPGCLLEKGPEGPTERYRQ
jgi:hexokinase